MCDEQSDKELEAYLAKMGKEASGSITRRQFTKLSAGALAMAGVSTFGIAPASGALELKEEKVTIKTPDGEADCFFAYPAEGKHPAVLVWPDIYGLRSAFEEMGRQLASAGYAVLTVNPYYRTTMSPVVPEDSGMSQDEIRTEVRKHAGTLTPETNVTDAHAFIAWLDSQEPVDTSKGVGTTGYCMGGPMTMRTAAAVPERVMAGASFHGGRLVSDKPDSPHLLVDEMKASYLFAIAENDDERQPEAKDVLRETFDAAGLPAEIEVYKGAMHGWCALDSRAFHEELAAKAWGRLLHLFETSLA